MVHFHLVFALWSLASVDGKAWKRSKFSRILQSCILQTKTDSLKPCILLGVCLSVKFVLQTKNAKVTLLCTSMFVTYFIRFLQTKADRHNSISMSLLLLVAEKITRPRRITSCIKVWRDPVICIFWNFGIQIRSVFWPILHLVFWYFKK